MNATKKLICILTAGATLTLAAPAFADPGRGRGHDYYRDQRQYSGYDYRGYREHERYYGRRPFVTMQRPVFVERPVYYAEPAPVAYVGPAAVIGAVIGGYIDSRR